MTIEEKLKDLILERYSSIREFTIKIDMSYSTVDSILKRGIQNATISNILKICDALHISADALANGEIVPLYKKHPSKEEPQDVADILAFAKQQLLSNKALMFNGKPADEESIQSILSAMEVGIEIAKRKGKQ
jgi:DNA-binding Xre family transcriptional regulator